jgi:hypothetical protein
MAHRNLLRHHLATCPPHPANQLAAWIRGHRKIENQLHWVRDVTFGEDLSEARTGTGPHVMASQRVTSPSASCASPGTPTSPGPCGA